MSIQALLRKKAADELKKEQERKAEARKKIISERCGQPRSLDGANEGELCWERILNNVFNERRDTS